LDVEWARSCGWEERTSEAVAIVKGDHRN
jgi:hypothetical protein